MTGRFDHIFIQPRNFDESIRFYRDGLGWRVKSNWGGGGAPRGAILESSGGMNLVLAEAHDSKDHADKDHADVAINGNRPTVHLNCQDVDARFAELKEKQRVVIGPENTHWGVRWFVLRDPDDNIVAISGPKAGT